MRRITGWILIALLATSAQAGGLYITEFGHAVDGGRGRGCRGARRGRLHRVPEPGRHPDAREERVDGGRNPLLDQARVRAGRGHDRDRGRQPDPRQRLERRRRRRPGARARRLLRSAGLGPLGLGLLGRIDLGSGARLRGRIQLRRTLLRHRGGAADAHRRSRLLLPAERPPDLRGRLAAHSWPARAGRRGSGCGAGLPRGIRQHLGRRGHRPRPRSSACCGRRATASASG